MSMRSILMFYVGLLFAASQVFGQVEITEFLARGGASLLDQDGDNSDWIELHNASDQSVTLEGWRLSDSEDPEMYWEFPPLDLGAGEYLVVFASGKDRSNPEEPLHTNFSLAGDGEYLALIRPDGTSASEWSPAFPPQRSNISFGMNPEGQPRFFTPATPGTVNGAGSLDFVADTRFSVDRGFFEAPFDLAIESDTPDATIRFTLDGSEPSATDGEDYVGPLRIDKTTILRAMALKEGFLPTNIDTQSYFFLQDVIGQSPNGAPPAGWPSTWGSNVVDYGMDPDIVNHPAYRDQIIDSLKSLPTYSLVTDLDYLFSIRNGIYANADLRGSRAERPASVELIYPDGKEGFQANAGLRIRGGFSRSDSNPKHAFRVFFREEYGPTKLQYPVFGEDAAQEFDTFDLRTFQNYSWSFQGDSQGVFVRDAVNRDMQLAMGHAGERGDFYHLYVNGHYWGLYNTCERPEASYGESYFGGSKEDYDVIKVAPDNSYTIEVTDGDIGAWGELFNITRRPVNLENYMRLQGLNLDGTRNAEYPVLLDIPNLIDYMLIIFYGGNLDAPISWFLSNQSPNNFYAVRNRNGEEGFRFFVHDAEHTLLLGRLFEDRTGPFPAGNVVTKSNPQYMFQQMSGVEEFRIRVGDHVQRHFFNGGLLSPQTVTNLFLNRVQQIDKAVIAESARWGDSKRGAPLNRNDHWEPQVRSLLNNYFPQRTQIVLDQLIQDGWFPDIPAPAYSQHGGTVLPGFQVTITAQAGEIYFTQDGTDPRAFGGELSPSARRYARTYTVNTTTTLKSRVRFNGQWSALNEAQFVVLRTFQDILVTEIMFHPALPEDPEFIELRSIATEPLDLGQAKFTDGIQYTFPSGFTLAPGGIVVLTDDEAAFRAKYPDIIPNGVYAGQLNNAGERIELQHASGGVIFSFEYLDAAQWPATADGLGYSMEYTGTQDNTGLSIPSAWRSSASLGGSPGEANPEIAVPQIQITEVFSASNDNEANGLELYNASTQPVDISHWYISDSKQTPAKFQLPAGTQVPPQGYLVLQESQFLANPDPNRAFGLNRFGEAIFLFAANEQGQLTGFAQGVDFPASDANLSSGVYVNSLGEIHFPTLIQPTLGQPNAQPKIGPVVITEIHYTPLDNNPEYVEIQNLAAGETPLFSTGDTPIPWELSGVQFIFPSGLVMAPNEIILLSGQDPQITRSRYNIPDSVRILGPFPGRLDDDGERLTLVKPIDDGFTGVDTVRYSNRLPWPREADSTGFSLERLDPTAYGDDPANWRFSPGFPSPGLDNLGNRPPHITLTGTQQIEADGLPVRITLSANVLDDGLPEAPGQTSLEWRALTPDAPVLIVSPNQGETEVVLYGSGEFQFELVANDGELKSTGRTMVNVQQKPALRSEVQVPFESEWKYLDNGSNQATAWRSPAFNDSAWNSGLAPLGYEQDGLNTLIGFGGNPDSKHVTTYFRTEWNVEDLDRIQALRLELDPLDIGFDGGDGSYGVYSATIVYLNGVEVFRSNFSPNSPTVTFITSAEPGFFEAGVESFYKGEIDRARLRQGRNILAVEMHRVDLYRLLNTNDLYTFFADCCGAPRSEVDAIIDFWQYNPLSFKMKIEADVQLGNTAPIAQAPSPLRFSRFTNLPLEVEIIDDGYPIPPGLLEFEWQLIEGPGDVEFENANLPETRMNVSAPGNYQLRLFTRDGVAETITDVTVIVEDTEEAFATWIGEHFNASELGDPGISGADADPDGDGHTNRQEFIAGTHPRSDSSVLSFGGIQFAASPGSTILLSIRTVAGKAYHVETARDLNALTWTRVQSFTADKEETTIDLPSEANGDAYYFRVSLDD